MTPLTFALGITTTFPAPLQQRPIGGGKLIFSVTFTNGTAAAMTATLD